MPDKYKMIIQVGGTKYPITTGESPTYVEELSREMDKGVKLLIDGSRISANEALVLLCLSYLDAYKKSEQSADHLRSQIAEYLEEAAKARTEAAEARKELSRLESRLKEKEGAGVKG